MKKSVNLSGNFLIILGLVVLTTAIVGVLAGDALTGAFFHSSTLPKEQLRANGVACTRDNQCLSSICLQGTCRQSRPEEVVPSLDSPGRGSPGRGRVFATYRGTQGTQNIIRGCDLINLDNYLPSLTSLNGHTFCAQNGYNSCNTIFIANVTNFPPSLPQSCGLQILCGPSLARFNNLQANPHNLPLTNNRCYAVDPSSNILLPEAAILCCNV